MREKKSIECIKTQKLPGPFSWQWTLATNGLLCSTMLHRQFSASEAGAPLGKILDQHLGKVLEFYRFGFVMIKWTVFSLVHNQLLGSSSTIVNVI